METEQFSQGAYAGYETRLSDQPDEELTQVGPGPPCGDYLRRFWHPVFLAKDLGDLPVALKILGEELVLFRDLSGKLGLVHQRCPHRLASLEYGRCEEHGDSLRFSCNKLGAEFLSVTTDEPLERVLSDFLRQRQSRGKSIRRHVNR